MNRPPKNAIKHKHEVEDAERTAVYRAGAFSSPSGASGNVFLVGLRGSGKTTVGRRAAKRLDRPFVDTDALIAERIGTTIADFVAENGWDAFRELEHQVLAEVCTRTGQIVATGGGIVLREDNRALLADHGVTFYLMADVDTLCARLRCNPNSAQRPALTDACSPREETARTLTARDPLYMQAARFILQAANSPDELAQDIEDKLRLL
ncbi:Shikimate kinase [Desulfovibrio sp. X2]|uniref:shikimate kinase AroL n=1 Tax=Desulfovibrio sp. X2 TaxID=941449 RepID=UPI0003588E64|nr:shikimate kinase AroL [Desulfovibrio sp. X2]EPR41934.1 Shikimate kinase [Desulfovibrio sp. X2]